MENSINTTTGYMTLDKGCLRTGQIEHARALFTNFNFTRTTLEQWIVIGAVNSYYKEHMKDSTIVGENRVDSEKAWMTTIRAEFAGINQHQIAGSIYVHDNQTDLLEWYEKQEITYNNVKYVAKAHRDYVKSLEPSSKRTAKLKEKQADERKAVEAFNSVTLRLKNLIDEVEGYKGKFDESETTEVERHLTRGLNAISKEETTTNE